MRTPQDTPDMRTPQYTGHLAFAVLVCILNKDTSIIGTLLSGLRVSGLHCMHVSGSLY